MTVVQGLPLNEAYIILGLILSMLFNHFKAQRPRSIPMTAFSRADVRQMSIYYQSHGILFLLHYHRIYVLVCICLYHAQLQMF